MSCCLHVQLGLEYHFVSSLPHCQNPYPFSLDRFPCICRTCLTLERAVLGYKIRLSETKDADVVPSGPSASETTKHETSFPASNRPSGLRGNDPAWNDRTRTRRRGDAVSTLQRTGRLLIRGGLGWTEQTQWLALALLGWVRVGLRLFLAPFVYLPLLRTLCVTSRSRAS